MVAPELLILLVAHLAPSTIISKALAPLLPAVVVIALIGIILDPAASIIIAHLLPIIIIRPLLVSPRVLLIAVHVIALLVLIVVARV